MDDSSGSDFHILLICEAQLDADVVSTLADRALLKKAPNWLADNLDTYRHWTGLEAGTLFTKQSHVHKTAKKLGLTFRYLGHTPDGAKKRNAAAALKVLQMARKLAVEGRPVKAVLYQQDADAAPDVRQQGLAQARAQHGDKTLLVTAEPNPKIEAWVLHGFEADGPVEAARLAAIRKELKLDPITEPHRLRGRTKNDQAQRDIKNVLDHLTDGSPERQKRCWNETPLTTLGAADRGTKLQDFLDQVEGPLLERLGRP